MITDQQLISIRDEFITNGLQPRSWMIAKRVTEKHNETLDQSTIRGRFVSMGQPLRGFVTPVTPVVTKQVEPIREVVAVKSVKCDKPVATNKDFDNYLQRDVDIDLATHYNLGKHPITQGKQGTGKTSAHEFYAKTSNLPFHLISCYEDMKLHKLFGDKTIINGTVRYQESEFVNAIQGPCVILFDEINAISNANSFDFHAMLQNRELFVKDANDGKGKVFKMHKDCRIGFSQNPRSNKYIGGTIKPSNFLGRCTFLTFPEFTKSQTKQIIKGRLKDYSSTALDNIVGAYFDLLDMIEKANIPIDISIRQLLNLCDFLSSGMDMNKAWDQSFIYFLDAASQPNLKASFVNCIGVRFPEVLNKKDRMETT